MKGQEVVGMTVKQNMSHVELPLLRGAFPAVVKSLSKKCLLQKYLLCSILAESVVQDIPTFPPKNTAL
jgi:hypothetical protein